MHGSLAPSMFVNRIEIRVKIIIIRWTPEDGYQEPKQNCRRAACRLPPASLLCERSRAHSVHAKLPPASLEYSRSLLEIHLDGAHVLHIRLLKRHLGI